MDKVAVPLRDRVLVNGPLLWKCYCGHRAIVREDQDVANHPEIQAHRREHKREKRHASV